MGTGTQKVAHILREYFNDVPIWILDRDHLKNDTDFQKNLDDIEQQQTGIIIGTQMLAKGHDFSRIAQVIYLNAYCNFDDFYHQESLIQLTTQVTGRAGRHFNEQNIMIQAYQLNKAFFKDFFQLGYLDWAKKTLVERKKNQQPPYDSCALILATSAQQKKPF